MNETGLSLAGLVEETGKVDRDRMLAMFRDKAGNKYMMDGRTGILYKEVGDKINKGATANESRHLSGYLAFQFRGDREMITYQHLCCNLLFHLEEFKKMREMHPNDDLVTCHINGCKWDNRENNLEWGTPKENVLQAKMVSTLKTVFGNKYIKEVKHPNTQISFSVLKQGIRNSQLNEFYKTRNWSGEKATVIAHEFVNFMISKGYWKEENYNEEH